MVSKRKLQGPDMTSERFAALTDFEKEEYAGATYETRRALETVACLRLDLSRTGSLLVGTTEDLSRAILTISELGRQRDDLQAKLGKAYDAQALAPFTCQLCGQRIDDGKPCGCGAR